MAQRDEDMQVDPPQDVAADPNSLPDLPVIPGRRYGIFMTKKHLMSLVEPVEGRRLLFAHNDIMRQLFSDLLTPSTWTFLLRSSYANNIKVTHAGITYTPFGTSYEVIICLELFGMYLPDAWSASQEISNMAMYQALKIIKPNLAGTSLTNLTTEDIDTIKTLLTTAKNEASNVNAAYSLLLTVLYSFTRTGHPTEQTKGKLITEFKSIKNIDVTIMSETVREYWSILAPHCNRYIASRIMNTIIQYFESKSIRLTNAVRFAKNRNLTQYWAVKEALERCPDFPWGVVALHAGSELIAYKNARKLVRDRPYFGYGPLGIAAAGYYPNLAYLCIQLCKRYLGQSSLQTYQGSSAQNVNRRLWDEEVDKYIHKARGEVTESQMESVSRETGIFLRSMRNRSLRYNDRDDNEQDDDNDQSSSSSSSDSDTSIDENDDQPGGAMGGPSTWPDSTGLHRLMDAASRQMPPPPAPQGGDKTPSSGGKTQASSSSKKKKTTKSKNKHLTSQIVTRSGRLTNRKNEDISNNQEGRERDRSAHSYSDERSDSENRDQQQSTSQSSTVESIQKVTVQSWFTGRRPVSYSPVEVPRVKDRLVRVQPSTSPLVDLVKWIPEVCPIKPEDLKKDPFNKLWNDMGLIEDNGDELLSVRAYGVKFTVDPDDLNVLAKKANMNSALILYNGYFFHPIMYFNPLSRPHLNKDLLGVLPALVEVICPGEDILNLLNEINPDGLAEAKKKEEATKKKTAK